MEIKEIKNIIYTVCAATLTVVVSICGVVLTKKAYRIMSNCEKITKHAANVGEMIDDKQFGEDVKKDVKGVFENHKVAAEKCAEAANNVNQAANNLNQAANNVATFTARLNAPPQPGEMGYNLNQAANNVATFTNDAREMMHVAKKKFIGNKPNSSTPAAPSDENNNSGSNSQDATGDGSGNTESNPQAASDSEEVPILDNLQDASVRVKSASQRLDNGLGSLDGGRIWSVIKTPNDEERNAEKKQQQASESNNGENPAGGNNQQVSAPMPNNGGMLNTIRNAFSIVFHR